MFSSETGVPLRYWCNEINAYSCNENYPLHSPLFIEEAALRTALRSQSVGQWHTVVTHYRILGGKNTNTSPGDEH